MAVLRVIHGPNSGCSMDVHSDLVIGRHPKHCNFVLDSRSVSRLHARIIRRGSDYFIEDLGSRNRTVLDAVTISPGERTTQPLKDGALIQVADVVLRFELTR